MIGPKYVVLTKVLPKNRVIPKIALIKAQANLTVSGIFRHHFFPNPTINTVLQ